MFLKGDFFSSLQLSMMMQIETTKNKLIIILFTYVNIYCIFDFENNFYMKLKKSLFIFISFFFCQIEILHAQNADINILRSIIVHRNTSLDNPMKFISKSEGYIGIGIPIAIVAVAYAREDSKLFQQGINMSLALIANTASTFVLKKIINRTRPAYTYSDIQAFENVQYHSFPSWHTSNAFCTAMSVSLNFKKASIIIPAFPTYNAFMYIIFGLFPLLKLKFVSLFPDTSM